MTANKDRYAGGQHGEHERLHRGESKEKHRDRKGNRNQVSCHHAALIDSQAASRGNMSACIREKPSEKLREQETKHSPRPLQGPKR